MSSPIGSVAVLGTGVIGSAVARNLAAAGLETSAWNRTSERARPLADDGVRVVEDIAEAVGGVDAVLTALSDGDAVEDVMAGAGGGLRSAEPGAVWIQTSTVGSGATERLAELAEDAEVHFVDAPVLGTKGPAEQGELIILASGPAAAVERCAPVFDVIGARTVDLGEEPGEGSRMKLVLNSWLLALTAGLAETINLAAALDVDPEEFLSIIEGGPLDVPYAHLKGAMMISRAYEPSFSLANAAKDARLVCEAAEGEDLELTLAAAVRDLFAEAVELGHAEADMAAVHEVGSSEADERPAAAP